MAWMATERGFASVMEPVNFSTSWMQTEGDPALSALHDLTLKKLTEAYEKIRQIICVNPVDIDQPIVKAAREKGFDVETNDLFPKGRGWLQMTFDEGIINFETNEATLWRRTDWPKFEWKSPFVGELSYRSRW